MNLITIGNTWIVMNNIIRVEVDSYGSAHYMYRFTAVNGDVTVYHVTQLEHNALKAQLTPHVLYVKTWSPNLEIEG